MLLSWSSILFIKKEKEMKENYQNKRRLNINSDIIKTVISIIIFLVFIYVKITSTYETRKICLPIVKLQEEENQNYSLDYLTGFPLGTHRYTGYKLCVEYKDNEEIINVSKNTYEKLKDKNIVTVKIVIVTDKWGLYSEEKLSIEDD